MFGASVHTQCFTGALLSDALLNDALMNLAEEISILSSCLTCFINVPSQDTLYTCSQQAEVASVGLQQVQSLHSICNENDIMLMTHADLCRLLPARPKSSTGLSSMKRMSGAVPLLLPS